MSEDYIISDNSKQLIDDVVKKFPNNQSKSAIIESLLIIQPVSYTHLTLPTKRIV